MGRGMWGFMASRNVGENLVTAKKLSQKDKINHFGRMTNDKKAFDNQCGVCNCGHSAVRNRDLWVHALRYPLREVVVGAIQPTAPLPLQQTLPDYRQ